MSQFSGYIAVLLALILLVGCEKQPDSLEHAQRMIELGNYEEAIRSLERTVELDEQNSEAYYLLGFCYQKVDRHDAALLALRQAFKLNPSARNQVALGQAYQSLGMDRRALEQFLAVLQGANTEAWIPAIAEATGDAHFVRQLTHNDVDDYEPTFAPDGSQIAITSFRVQNAELYLLDLDGRVRSRVTYTDDKNEGSPAFAPDNEWILCETVSNENREAGLVLQASGSTMTDDDLEAVHIYGREVQPAFPGESKGGKPDVSPDGMRVAFQSVRDGNLEIYVAERASGEITRLTHHPRDDGTPAFSPDGTQVAFVSSRSGNYELYTVSVGGGALNRLTHNDFGDYNPVFSPDGRSIAYVSEADGDIEIYQLFLETGRIKRLTKDIGASVQPSFSPDGRYLAFASDRSNFFQIYLMDLTRFPTNEELIQRIMSKLE